MRPLHGWVDRKLAQPEDPAARAVLVVDPNLVARVTHLLEHGQLSQADLCAVAARMWPLCAPAPQLEAPAAFWRRLFRLAGYAVDGFARPLPDQPVVLYRGAVEEHARGWPWTPNRVLAEAAASNKGVRKLWRTQAPPCAFLATFTYSRHTREVVVDPDVLGEIRCVAELEAAEVTIYHPLLTAGMGIYPRKQRPHAGRRIMGV